MSYTTTYRTALSFEADDGVEYTLVREEVAMIKGEQIHDKQIKVTVLFRSGASENWAMRPEMWAELRLAIIKGDR